MSLSFFALALVTLGGAVAAITLRNLVHCALALGVAFAGLAGIYLTLDAQFVGFAQVLIYIGAISMLIVFAILLTRGAEPPGTAAFSRSWPLGAGVALAVFAVLGKVICSGSLGQHGPEPAATSVRQIGDELMAKYVLPLQVLGLLLTAALIGAVVIAMCWRRQP
jgi:NADH-quinone oxidoreductase subunit J